MNRNRSIVIVGSIVLGLIVLAVSALVGGGWALVLLEVASAGIVIVLFLRGQNEDQDSEPNDQ